MTPPIFFLHFCVFYKFERDFFFKLFQGSTDADSEPVQEKPTRHIEESYKPVPRPKKQLPAPVVTTTPSVKRPRLSASSNDSQSAPMPIAKSEPTSTPISNVDSGAVQFKVEPYDQNQSVTIPDDGDDNFGDDTLDDNTVDDTEDYAMMEGEEPQAGTSTDGTGEGQGRCRFLLHCKPVCCVSWYDSTLH